MKVFLITKLTTSNVGNEVLSNELIRLFDEVAGQGNLRVEGRPMGLDGYQLSRLENHKDPVQAFERWADEIINTFSHTREPTAFVPRTEKTRLVHYRPTARKAETIKALLRPVKRYLWRWITLTETYRRRLRAIQASDCVVYSGAGEVGDNNVYLRQLLELRLAQKLGKKTAIVNQSIVIRTTLFKLLVGHVYGKLDQLVVRGETSKELLRTVGVPEGKIEVAPDTALFTQIAQENSPVRNSRVGINFTPRVPLTSEALFLIIDSIRGLGYEVVFVTNEPYEDFEVAKRLNSEFNVPQVGVGMNYEAYTGELKKLSFLISTRLHTNVLGLVAETPVIPVEGNRFKTKELLEQLEYPISVIDTTQELWSVRLKEEVMKIHNKKYDFPAYFNQVLPGHRKRVRENAAWLEKFVNKETLHRD